MTTWLVGFTATARERRGNAAGGADRLCLSMVKVTGNTAVDPVLGCAGSFLCFLVMREARDLRDGGRVVGKENGLIVLADPESEVSQEVGVPFAEASVIICGGGAFL